MDSLLVSMRWLNHLLLCMWACTVSRLLSWLRQAFLSATGFWGRARGCVLRRRCKHCRQQTGNFALVLAKSHFKVNNLFTLGPGSEHPLMAQCSMSCDLGAGPVAANLR